MACTLLLLLGKNQQRGVALGKAIGMSPSRRQSARCGSPPEHGRDNSTSTPCRNSSCTAAHPDRWSIHASYWNASGRENPCRHRHRSRPCRESFSASELIPLLDAAGVRRALVLSLAYQYGNPNRPPVTGEYVHVQRENNWTARHVAEFPDRLRAFCGVDPLKPPTQLPKLNGAPRTDTCTTVSSCTSATPMWTSMIRTRWNCCVASSILRRNMEWQSWFTCNRR